ncbi:DUF4403 family protein [Deinococcus sp. KSM4-11]|uniref:DUF4403 family protein n=1 Tax=Deinococcus sp. KSM4-11 TaxID=2568654 RepID=UPI001F0F2C74|nr:DUF4403 family protein [Deinococcus sp. KSM4-11]
MSASALAASSAEPAASSTLAVPLTVPLAGVQVAANARVPAEFARLDETRSYLGGLLSVQLTGTVTRVGHVSVHPSADGAGLVVSVPIRAAFRAGPGGTGAILARNFGGEATVRLTVTPYVTPEWDAGVRVVGSALWTDPLGVDLAPGVRISVQSLVESQVQAQLDRVAAEVERAVQQGARLRERAQALWTRGQQPWALPTPEPASALVTGRTLAVTPVRVTPDAVTFTLGAAFDLRAQLGQAVPLDAPSPLPPVRVGPVQDGVQLSVPARLAWPDLSRLATSYAAARTIPLPVPTHPTLRVLDVTLTPAGEQVRAAVHVQVSGPLGLKVQATANVTGTPVLDSAGRTLTLEGATVVTRREGLTGRVIGWLADARAQAFVRQAAHVELGPLLERARTQAQARLPFRPVPGVTLSGTVGTLHLSGLDVTPGALIVTAAASGTLAARVDVAGLDAAAGRAR